MNNRSDDKKGEVLTKIQAALAMVHALCLGKRTWTMSVPAQPDYDPDEETTVREMTRDESAWMHTQCEGLERELSRIYYGTEFDYSYALKRWKDLAFNLESALTRAGRDISLQRSEKGTG